MLFPVDSRWSTAASIQQRLIHLETPKHQRPQNHDFLQKGADPSSAQRSHSASVFRNHRRARVCRCGDVTVDVLACFTRDLNDFLYRSEDGLLSEAHFTLWFCFPDLTADVRIGTFILTEAVSGFVLSQLKVLVHSCTVSLGTE